MNWRIKRAKVSVGLIIRKTTSYFYMELNRTIKEYDKY